MFTTPATGILPPSIPPILPIFFQTTTQFASTFYPATSPSVVPYARDVLIMRDLISGRNYEQAFAQNEKAFDQLTSTSEEAVPLFLEGVINGSLLHEFYPASSTADRVARQSLSALLLTSAFDLISGERHTLLSAYVPVIGLTRAFLLTQIGNLMPPQAETYFGSATEVLSEAQARIPEEFASHAELASKMGFLAKLVRLEVLRGRLLATSDDDVANELSQLLRDLFAESASSGGESVPALARYEADAAMILASQGKFKAGLAAAEHLKATPPFNETAEAEIILDPKTRIAYKAAHPAFQVREDETTRVPARSIMHGGARLLATNLYGTFYKENVEPDLEGLAELRRRLSVHGVKLAYISGASLFDVWDIILSNALPVPDYVASEVGTRIYHRHEGEWLEVAEWRKKLEAQWGPELLHELEAIMSAYPDAVRPKFSQSHFKMSYRIPSDESSRVWQERIGNVLEQRGLKVTLAIGGHRGKIHINFLPVDGSKLSAITFIGRREALPLSQVLTAGHSGEDFDTLTSGAQAMFLGYENDIIERLRGLENVYIPQQRMVRGVLEGLAHFGLE